MNLIENINNSSSERINFDKSLGDFIMSHRKKNLLTIAGLAERVDFTPQYISSVEKGSRFPSIEFLEQVSKPLHIDIYSLLEKRFLSINNTVIDHFSDVPQHLKNEFLLLKYYDFIRKT